MEARIEKLKKIFEEQFNIKPNDIFSSPGRIELLGNHTDHNNGKVLVSSINLDILGLTNKSDNVTIVSVDYGIINVNIDDLSYQKEESFTSVALVKGVLYKLKELGYQIGGFNAVIDSCIPKGAGVSSSAAFELFIAEVINYYYNNDQIDKYVLATISQYSESIYYGKACGMLDQTGISFGGINYIDFKDVKHPVIHSLQIDFSSYQFILVNTLGSHENLTSYYQAIKDDMKTLANHFNQDVLREVEYNDFLLKKAELINQYGEKVYNRGIHFFEENKRVENAFNALKNNDFIQFLDDLKASGVSSYCYLRNCYCISEKENLAEGLCFVKNIPSSYSRVHGGGFAGTLLFVCPIDDVNKNIELLNEHFGLTNVMPIALNKYGTRHIGEVK